MCGKDILRGISMGTFEFHRKYLTNTLEDTILYSVENLRALGLNKCF